MRLWTLLALSLQASLLLAQPLVNITDFSGPEALNGNVVTGMTMDRRGLLWVSTWGGLYRYDGYQFISYKVRPGDGNDLDNSRIDDVQQEIHGNLICRSYATFYLYDIKTNRFRKLKDAKGIEAGRHRLHFSRVFQREGYQLKVEKDRLLYYDLISKQWQTLVDSVQMATVSSTGVVWALLGDNRLKRIIVKRQKYDMADAGESIRALHRDRQGRIWQANDDGSILLRDPFGKKLGYITPDGRLSNTKAIMTVTFDIDDDRDGNVFLASRIEGLFVLSPEGNTFRVSHYTHNPNDPYSISDNEIFSVLCDSDAVWVGTLRGGLNLMKKEHGTIVFLNRNNRCHNFPPHEQLFGIRPIIKVGETIAIGTSNGLYTFKGQTTTPENIRFHHSIRQKDNPKSLASNSIISVGHFGKKGLYVCTSHGGLCHATSANLLQDNLKFDTWNMDAGAPSDQTLWSFADNNGDIWIVFENYLSKFDDKTMSSVDFVADDPRIGNLRGTKPILCDDGTAWLATTRGLAHIQLNQLIPTPSSPSILITSLAANGRNIPYSLNADTIVLTKDQRNFTIEFAALEMAGTEHVEYAYMMEGRDTIWVKNGHHRSLSFFNLGAGTHHLLIKATDNNRIWSDKVRRVTIIVQPTFWETPWAWLLYTTAGLLTAILLLLVIMYIYRLRLNASFEKRMADIKLRYFTNISHDLRTPLTLIEGPVTEMLQDDALSPKNRNLLNLVHSNTRRMLTLVNQILDLRKIQNNKMHLLIERMDLKAELSTVMSDFRHLADDHQVSFTLNDHTTEAAFIWGDRDKVQKIFFNLLSNAFKYTGHGQRIWIELESDEQTVSATISDTGKGIPQQALGRLLARFETIISDNYMQASTGIGLSLVNELVQLHHARLIIESKEHEGSHFKVVFPKGNKHFIHDENAQLMTVTDRPQATTEQEEQTATSDEEPTTHNISSKTRILVVEDDAEMLQFVLSILDKTYQVIPAVDGQDGLEKADEQQPDLIISDINMPRMDGWQMVEALKARVETSHIPIVLLTANSTIDDRIRGAAQGVDDYLVKPFSTKYLRVRVAAILQKQQQQQQHFVKAFTHDTGLTLPTDNSGVEQRLVEMDRQFMNRLRTFLEEHLSEATPMQELAAHLGMSRTLFYNKIRSITGMTPVDFYRKYHVERAAQKMRSEGLTVSEACYATGFSDPKYFSKVFKKFMGVKPSDYRNSKEEEQ
jgi:signal transduction histidine kinase/DNA-binding response OmpR family regulator/ligand-binding sensor domain-containing protein